ncbi:hypothetical protein [Haloarchaeobius sp. DYHT-AS-18]|uniref:hypothetical protein n=1 Tax=Haloarchaeobius sp. DYHT-AS-18 TaxID=3446117 RepID=UPI003EBCF7E5
MPVFNPPGMEHPNIICPKCGLQFEKSELVSANPSSFANLTQTISCPSCSSDFHPEDGTLEYFDKVSSNQVIGHPLTVGGCTNIGTIELPIGETTEENIETNSDFKVSLALQGETDKQPGLGIDDLDGAKIKWHDGHLLIDDAVVVDSVSISDSEVGFITSQRTQTNQNTVTIAYNIQSRYSGVEQPPWAELLEEAAAVFYRGRGIAEYPLVFSAFENFLGRELARTLHSQGKSQQYIENYLEDKHTNMYGRFNDALDDVTGYRFEDYDNSTYTKIDDYREERNDRIVHVDPKDRAAKISVQDMKDCFSTIIEAMLVIHEICYDERN